MARPQVKDITGQIFGELTVLRREGSNNGATWVCMCSCGEECVELGYRLISGHTKTCGHPKRFCNKGHEFTPENTYVDANGVQVCRTCKREWYHDNKEPLSGKHKNQNTDKTHCIRGHELSGENLVIKLDKKSGKEHRICRVCRNEEAKTLSRVRDAKHRALEKSDPIKWAKERRRRRSYQLQKIGWTIELWDKMWEEQEGKCAICKRILNINVKHNEDKAHADHAHIEPPAPREILCVNCNIGIGLLKENLEIMQAAVAYVEKWKVKIGP